MNIFFLSPGAPGYVWDFYETSVIFRIAIRMLLLG